MSEPLDVLVVHIPTTATEEVLAALPDPPTRVGVSLRDRPTGPPAADKGAVEGPATPRRRHCWLDLTGHATFASDTEAEGLVLQWAQDERGWVALVVFVVPADDGDRTVQAWMPAARLRPDRDG